ncbi:hypothetical protein LCGC14_2578890, partial [marine sediment metagenome]
DLEGTSDEDIDTDNDLINDGDEYYISESVYSRPTLFDTDGDGLNDGIEVNTVGTDPGLSNTDGDYLNDFDEYSLGFDATDPTDPINPNIVWNSSSFYADSFTGFLNHQGADYVLVYYRVSQSDSWIYKGLYYSGSVGINLQTYQNDLWLRTKYWTEWTNIQLSDDEFYFSDSYNYKPHYPTYDPPTPTGPSSGYTYTYYSFNFVGDDLDHDDITFQVNWGDGSTSSYYIAYYGSYPYTKAASHQFTSTGTKYIKYRIMDENGAYSNWSPSKSIYLSSNGGGSGGGCVAKDTLILLPDGYTKIPVQKLNVGEYVLGYNVTSGETIPVLVTEIDVSKVSSILKIGHDKGSLRITPYNQPIWYKNETYTGWLIDPINIQEGDQIFHIPSDSWVTVNKLILIENGSHEVYDIVTDPLNVFVGNGILLDKKVME